VGLYYRAFGRSVHCSYAAQGSGRIKVFGIVKTWLSKIYPGTVASFGLATLTMCWIGVFTLEGKPVPTLFDYAFVGLTGVGSAIAASGSGPTP
jgi:hypothetical protein